MKVGQDYDGRNLVFLVGCPRSGTTWLQRLIATHPDVQTGQETHLFSHFLGPQLRGFRNQVNRALQPTGRRIGLPAYLTEREFLQFIQGSLIALLDPILAQTEDSQIFLEKTPSHALWVQEIHELLPAATFIELRRNPREVAASLVAANRGWGEWWAPQNVNQAVSLWTRHVRAVEEATRSMHKDLIHHVRYERLLAQPQDELRKIYEFLGVTCTEDLINLAITKNSRTQQLNEHGTPIPLRGEYKLRGLKDSTEPTGFIRHEDSRPPLARLGLLERLKLEYLLRKTRPLAG